MKEGRIANDDPQVCSLGEGWSAVPFFVIRKAGKDLGKEIDYKYSGVCNLWFILGRNV